MTAEAKIYAKEQQIKIIDNILCSLCSLELTADGRKYLNKMKARINKELEYLKLQKINEKQSRGGVSFLGRMRYEFPDPEISA
jgi:hypothetical protein